MKTGQLTSIAASLADEWISLAIGKIGGANIKVIKMGGEGIPDEVHPDFDELLVVIQGYMQLVVDNETFSLQEGEYFLVSQGSVHRVLPGSYGTLLLVDVDSPPHSAPF
ncbi:cupin domain-containing protein [Rouxiella sp. Mn2063]|uniref:cupin domain-containing protein n=1 Tax=Rouxiella sp. Mn2063 TaxID=3395262 RepID=UPI003BE63DB1